MTRRCRWRCGWNGLKPWSMTPARRLATLETELEAMRGEAGTDIRINPLKLKDRRQLVTGLPGAA